MNDKLLEYAYAGLLHDIGKFYQRTELKSNLSQQEYECSPLHKYGYHTHIHSGYTSKFIKKYLGMENNLERASSSHHLNNLDDLDSAVRRADCIASSIDRNDEDYDDEETHLKTRYKYLISRLNSIFYEIDFGENRNRAYFSLDSIDNITVPNKKIIELSKEEASDEYLNLFKRFVNEVQKDNLLYGKPTPFKYHRLYSLLYKYTTFMPASTYETDHPTVSLFDHLKLTSAIASCLSYGKNETFYMFEFDISGIQSFIYKITEGTTLKQKVAKSLRGRSALVSLITNAITYAILNEFSLTESNIIFNTGGGGIILLPYLDDTGIRIKHVCEKIQKQLYRRFNTQLTFVYVYEKLDAKELESFKSEKALSLKVKLDEAKQQKYIHFINDEFVFERLEERKLCQLCQDHYVTKDGICDLCNEMIDISDYYTKHNQFLVLYDFNNTFQGKKADLMIDFEFVKLLFLERIDDDLIDNESFYYLDSVNSFECGNIKLTANIVPRNQSFEEIVKMIDEKYGDQKLGILKMDVDNLGAIFAFGLKQKNDSAYELQRSLSKYLTLSRLMEFFFSQRLKDICLQLSQRYTSYENIFYINYAGGDDLVIMISVYAIVQLAEEIHKEFKDYVNNENITISGGIYIQNPKKPVRFGIQYADDALELSKQAKEKNSITILDTTVSFGDYRDILRKVEKYRNYIANEKISRTNFYRIMNYINDGSIEEYYEAIPKIQYSLYRNISDEAVRLDVSKDLTTIRDSLYDLKKLVLMMKLTILFTREVK